MKSINKLSEFRNFNLSSIMGGEVSITYQLTSGYQGKKGEAGQDDMMITTDTTGKNGTTQDGMYVCQEQRMDWQQLPDWATKQMNG